jgi:hypothetical protein
MDTEVRQAQHNSNKNVFHIALRLLPPLALPLLPVLPPVLLLLLQLLPLTLPLLLLLLLLLLPPLLLLLLTLTSSISPSKSRPLVSGL